MIRLTGGSQNTRAVFTVNANSIRAVNPARFNQRIGQMFVKLVSEDRDLYKLCRESLGEIPGHNWNISAVASPEDDVGSDLWLWDYHPAMVLPEYTTHSPSKHLFLVHRKDLAGFRSRASV